MVCRRNVAHAAPPRPTHATLRPLPPLTHSPHSLPPPTPSLPPSLCSDRGIARITDSSLVFKFLVPAQAVGAMVGRGGATVAAVKQRTGAYVQFTRPGTATNNYKERMMIVAVESRQMLQDALRFLFEAVEAVRACMRACVYACMHALRGCRNFEAAVIVLPSCPPLAGVCGEAGPTALSARAGGPLQQPSPFCTHTRPRPLPQESATALLRSKAYAPDKLFLQQVIPAPCAGKVMGPGGEDIKALSERCRCSVVVEGKVANAAFVPFRLVNYLAHDVRQIIAAVGDVSGQLCKDDKYEAGE